MLKPRRQSLLTSDKSGSSNSESSSIKTSSSAISSFADYNPPKRIRRVKFAEPLEQLYESDTPKIKITRRSPIKRTPTSFKTSVPPLVSSVLKDSDYKRPEYRGEIKPTKRAEILESYYAKERGKRKDFFDWTESLKPVYDENTYETNFSLFILSLSMFFIIFYTTFTQHKNSKEKIIKNTYLFFMAAFTYIMLFVLDNGITDLILIIFITGYIVITAIFWIISKAENSDIIDYVHFIVSLILASSVFFALYFR